jgi:galactokinase
MSSSVMVGSGLSSSASVEMLFGSILNTLYNEGQISPLSLAMIGQYAENVYFGKPSGCMDQLACAIGGIIAIDFKETGNPLVTKVSFDLRGQKYKLMVVDTNGSHENLTSEYAAVPAEMKSVAGYFGKATCREISVDDVIRGAKDMRHILGDRAILRSMHFLEENERVDRQIDALQKNDFPAFLKLVNESGNSSFKWLQNCFAAAKSFEQAIPIALVFTQRYIDAAGEGACRVHGGGFAGTIQVYLPEDHVKGYRKLMSTIFDDNCVKELMIRPFGHVCLNDMVTKENTVKENTCSTLRSR